MVKPTQHKIAADYKRFELEFAGFPGHVWIEYDQEESVKRKRKGSRYVQIFIQRDLFTRFVI